MFKTTKQNEGTKKDRNRKEKKNIESEKNASSVLTELSLLLFFPARRMCSDSIGLVVLEEW